MKEIDRVTIEEVGIPSLVLMEVAGRAVADAVENLSEDLEERGPILALAGTGNNGADAVVAARHLEERLFEVTLMVLGDEAHCSGEMKTQLKIAQSLGIEAAFIQDAAAVREALETHPVVIDGLFGTGLSRDIEGWRAELISAVDASGCSVVAVDIPSGIDGDTGQIRGTAVFADVTVTFQFPKFGQLLYPGREHVGLLQAVDIGIPPSKLDAVGAYAEIIEDALLELALPPRAPNSHKGSYGHLLLVAGAPDRPGSALLAGRAALRCGTGLVTVGSDRETIGRIAPALDELMGLSLSIDPGQLLAALEQKTALAIGPSLQPSDALALALQDFLLQARVPAVLDAGAISALSGKFKWLAKRQSPTVITPHPGEMARLLNVNTIAVQEDRIGVARRVAEESGAHVVLKGASTVVADPDGSVGLILRGHPGMATGGSGDVLTGVIGGLLAQGLPAGLSARVGALMHAWAADIAAERTGQVGMVASDIISAIPSVLAATEAQ